MSATQRLHPANVSAEDLSAKPVQRHQTLVPEADLAVCLETLPKETCKEDSTDDDTFRQPQERTDLQVRCTSSTKRLKTFVEGIS